MHILQGASDTLNEVVGLEIEVSFFPIRKNQPLFHDINKYMLANDFELYDLSQICLVMEYVETDLD